MPRWSCFLLLLTMTQASSASADNLPSPLRETLARHRLPLESLSVYVQDVTQNQPLLALNPDQPRNPASVIKIVTSFAALDVLGPAYTWKTMAHATGPLTAEGRLDGDLVLKGFGDPFLVIEAFWKLLSEVRNRGVRDIAGDLVIDSSFFSPPPHDPGEFDAQPFDPYNVGPNALLLNFQAVGFTLIPDHAGKRVRIALEPDPVSLQIFNELSYVGGRCRGRHRRILTRIEPSAHGASIDFRGSYPASCGESMIYKAVLGPVEMVDGVFRRLWPQLGGDLAGHTRVATLPPDARHLYTLESRPLAELLRGINKYSNNVMARHLLLTMGAEKLEPPGTLEKGQAAVRHWLQSQRLDFPELLLDNGSGLSRRTRVSARSLGRLLVSAYHHPLWPELAASLPIAGVDGTLRRRFRGESLVRRLRMKTGTIDDVKGIAGYLSSRSGRTWAVAILQNHPGVHRGSGTEVQNVLLRWLFEK